MRNFDCVKCLHCHYAHFLARPEHGNIIGQWTHEALRELTQDSDGRDQRKADREGVRL